MFLHDLGEPARAHGAFSLERALPSDSLVFIRELFLFDRGLLLHQEIPQK